MIETVSLFVLKLVHIVALMLGAAGGMGAMALARQMRRSGGSGGSGDVAAMRPFFVGLSLWGVVLIWISGLGLWMLRYDFANLGPAYALKLLAAATLLGVVLAVHTITRRAAREKSPPPAWLPKLSMSAPMLTLLAVVLAVWVFV